MRRMWPQEGVGMPSDALLKKAAIHELGHSFLKFLLTGTPGGIELKWLAPGQGSCQTRYPKQWPDELSHFWLFAGLTSAGGHAAETLFDQFSDPSWSAGDRDDLHMACRELMDLGEFKGFEDVARMGGVLQDIARHLLRPHQALLETLAATAVGYQVWNGTDIHDAILIEAPAFKGFHGFFDDDDWYRAWLAILEHFNDTEDRKYERYADLQRRLHRRFGGWGDEAHAWAGSPTGATTGCGGRFVSGVAGDADRVIPAAAHRSGSRDVESGHARTPPRQPHGRPDEEWVHAFEALREAMARAMYRRSRL
jgi:hypothetical protein